MRYKVLVSLFAFLSLLGFADASYLTAKHYLGTSIPCSILNGCDTVTTSAYSMVGPIPIALLGALYYFTVFVLSAYALSMNSKKAAYSASLITAAGFLTSLYLVYLQIFVIEALCLYCMISAAISIILFLLSFPLRQALATPEEKIVA